MLRMTFSARRRTRGGAGSALALALALSCGAVVGTAALGTPAQAQNTKEFAAVYQPVADVVNAEGGDIASVTGQIPAIVAAAQTADDRFAAGNLILVAGNKTKNPQLQRQGLELMVASGKTAPEQLGQFHFFIGSLAMNAKDYAAARTAFQAALAAGYTGDDADGLIAESYFSEGLRSQGLTHLKGMIDKRVAAGQPVEENWLRRGLQLAYEGGAAAEITDWSALHVKNSRSDKKWLEALQVVGSVSDTDSQVQLDLLRLMALTNALSARNEYVAYIEAADPRIMSNEVGRVLDSAVKAGVLSASDSYYTEIKRVVDERAGQDRRDAPQLAREARSAAAARDAQSAGDVYLSLASYAEAEEMYKLALGKTGADRDRLLTRLGIAQVHQGKLADAQASFAQVSGARAPVARMWSEYAASRA